MNLKDHLGPIPCHGQLLITRSAVLPNTGVSLSSWTKYLVFPGRLEDQNQTNINAAIIFCDQQHWSMHSQHRALCHVSRGWQEGAKVAQLAGGSQQTHQTPALRWSQMPNVLNGNSGFQTSTATTPLSERFQSQLRSSTF